MHRRLGLATHSLHIGSHLISDLLPPPRVYTREIRKQGRGSRYSHGVSLLLCYPLGGKRKSLRQTSQIVLNSNALSTRYGFTVRGQGTLLAGATGSLRTLYSNLAVTKTSQVAEEGGREVRNSSSWSTGKHSWEHTPGVRPSDRILVLWCTGTTAVSGNSSGCHNREGWC